MGTDTRETTCILCVYPLIPDANASLTRSNAVLLLAHSTQTLLMYYCPRTRLHHHTTRRNSISGDAGQESKRRVQRPPCFEVGAAGLRTEALSDDREEGVEEDVAAETNQ